MGSDSLEVSSGTAVKQALRRNLSLNPALALWDGGKNHESPAGYFLMCKVGYQIFLVTTVKLTWGQREKIPCVRKRAVCDYSEG